MLKIHILTDNNVTKPGMLAEHGLSLWIEKDDRRILFDTGQSVVFCHNAKVMGIDLGKTDYIILSHGHFDHCGGLQFFPHSNEIPMVYAHPDIFLKKFVVIGKDKKLREVGVPWEMEKLVGRLIYTRKPLMIEDGVMLSGEIPNSTNYEVASADFYMEKDGRMMHDLMLDEQMLILEDGNGVAIFLGCSHPGVVNCLKYARRLFPDKKINLLVAGMHLENASPLLLQTTIQDIFDMGIQKVVPLHCTSFGAMCELKQLLGDRCLISAVGDVIEA